MDGQIINRTFSQETAINVLSENKSQLIRSYVCKLTYVTYLTYDITKYVTSVTYTTYLFEPKL